MTSVRNRYKQPRSFRTGDLVLRKTKDESVERKSKPSYEVKPYVVIVTGERGNYTIQFQRKVNSRCHWEHVNGWDTPTWETVVNIDNSLMCKEYFSQCKKLSPTEKHSMLMLAETYMAADDELDEALGSRRSVGSTSNSPHSAQGPC